MSLRIGVMGAGSIGCYVGGQLLARGADVIFVGRERTRAELAGAGLSLVDLDGQTTRVEPARVDYRLEAAALADRDVVLVCVKSGATAEAGTALSAALPSGALVASFQNGLRNAEVLRAAMPAQRVLAGIVTFNVVTRGDGVFRCATSGPLVLERTDDRRLAALAEALVGAGFLVETPVDIRPQQWTKLLMNLNNAISALTDRPTAELIFDAGYRRILAALIGEALAVLRRAGVRTARLGAPLPVSLFPYLLKLPTPLLRLVARRQIRIDPTARSSMWEDLTRGRLTEVDQLNGEVVRLAERCGAAAPLNRRVVELVHRVERSGLGSPVLDAAALWRELTAFSVR